MSSDLVTGFSGEGSEGLPVHSAASWKLPTLPDTRLAGRGAQWVRGACNENIHLKHVSGGGRLHRYFNDPIYGKIGAAKACCSLKIG